MKKRRASKVTKPSKARSERHFTNSREFLFWSCMALLVQVAAIPTFLAGSLQLLPFPDQSVVKPEALWDVPLSGLTILVALADLPHWIVAVVISVLVGWLAKMASKSLHPLIVLCGILALPTITHPLAEYGAILVAGALFYFSLHRQKERHGLVLCLAIGLFLIGLLCCLEFGLLAAFITFTTVLPVVQEVSRTSRARSLAFAAIWIGTLLLPSVLSAGYLDALLRPVSWAWLDLPPDLMPSMVPIWQSDFCGKLSFENVGLAIFLLDTFRKCCVGAIRNTDMVLYGLCFGILFGCAYYLNLVCWAVFVHQIFSAKFDRTEPEPSTHPNPIYAPRVKATFALAILLLAAQVLIQTPVMLTAAYSQRIVDPNQWQLSGNVLLTNLEQANYWQQPALRERFRPILTNRWDAFSDQYTEYSTLCEDWRSWKREAYVLPDGTWGGYQERFKEWNPQLVVVDSRDLAALRRVSLDSKWKAIGLDYQRTLFASTDNLAAVPLIVRASTLLLTLEFPRPARSADFEQVLAIGSYDDGCRVAACLTALRLPFASIKTLAFDGAAPRSAATVLAYCELAHRSLRYSGTPSLLDSSRAFAGSRVSGERHILNQLSDFRLELRSQTDEKIPDSMSEPAIREAILRGAPVDHLVGKLADDSLREFYTLLANAWNLSAMELFMGLQQIDEARLTPELACERSFYLGCLAIELNNVGEANANLSVAANAEVPSPYVMLANLYLAQMNSG